MLTTRLPELTEKEFSRIREFVHQKFGLDLRDGKQQLVSARLSKHLRAGKFSSFDAYFSHATNDQTGESLINLIDALTTNHTSFLREASHFRFLKEKISSRKNLPASIWCAASSTGEEPYTILFSVMEAEGYPARPRLQLTASDISRSVLQAAQAGIYPSQKVVDLSPDWRTRFFVKPPKGAEGSLQVRPEYRSLIDWKRLNLLERFPFRNRFDFIFCRNVMIYFDKKTQADVVNRMSELLEPNGYLFVGHSESLTGIRHNLTYVSPATYQLKS